MFMKLMYITNNPDLAKIADKAGVDWIFVDLETIGKKERQGHLDTVISNHKIEDIPRVKNAVKNSKILVRVNPINPGSQLEINKAIEYGADIVMLPFFKTEYEVNKFLEIVNKRVQTCLLLETGLAVQRLNQIIEIEGIDFIHVGLNDLHLDLNKKFMFEFLIDGTLDSIFQKIKKTNIEYGFGGIARIGYGLLPAENIIIEHYRRGSKMAILSRSFMQHDIMELKDKDLIEEEFIRNVKEIRDLEKKAQKFNTKEYSDNYVSTEKIIKDLIG